MTAQEIINDERELFMNSPIGYVFAERRSQKDVNGMKGFLINIFNDEVYSESIRQSEPVEVVQSLLNNGFTFDPEWYGVRNLPVGRDGKPMSRLDDPEYQRHLGFRP